MTTNNRYKSNTPGFITSPATMVNPMIKIVSENNIKHVLVQTNTCFFSVVKYKKKHSNKI